MSKLQECIEQLNKFDTIPARPKKNRYVATDILKDMFEKYISMTDSDKKIFNKSINIEIGKKLINYSDVLAIRAIDENDLIWIRVGIMTHIWEGSRIDYRENFFNLIFLYFASTQLHIDFKNEVKFLEKFATPKTIEMLNLFNSRDSALNSLKSMGIEYNCIDNTSEFRQIG